MQALLSTGVATLCCWFVGSSLWIYPHSLSYFNESIGGPLNGAEHLLGSNLDWGQDLRYVIKMADCLNVGGDWHLVYAGYFNPRCMGIDFQLSGCNGLARTDDRAVPSGEQARRALVSLNYVRVAPARFYVDGCVYVGAGDLKLAHRMQGNQNVAGYSFGVYEIEK